MKTLTEKYNGALKGLFSESQFLRDARMQFPNLIHPNNNFKDASRILQGKGIISEGMSDEEYADAKEAERLEKHPEKKKIQAVQDLIRKEKPVKEASGPVQLNVVFNDTEDYIRAKQWFSEESDFYASSEHDEFQTLSFEVADQDDADATERAIDQELQGSEIQSWRFELMEGVVTEMDVNDPVLMRLRAAKDRRKQYRKDAEKLHYTHSRNIEQKLQSLERTRQQVLSDMEQEAEPEGGPIADLYGDELNKIDQAIARLTGRGKEKDVELSYDKAIGRVAMIKEEIDEELLDAIQTAMRTSKEEGVAQHVNELPGGGYTISDFYDSDSTVASFENGRKLNEVVKEAVQLQRNDMLRHEPTGLELRVSVVKPNRISGVVTKAGDLSSKLKVGDVTAFKPVLVGSTWKKFQDLSENIDPLVQRIPLNTLEHGIRFELDQKGLGTDCTVDEYEKAKKAAIKNLQKDLMYYRRKEGAQDMPVSKTDQMVKAKLKESVKHLIKKLLSEDKPKGFAGRAFTKNGKLK